MEHRPDLWSQHDVLVTMSGRGNIRGPLVLAKYVVEALKKKSEVRMDECVCDFYVFMLNDRVSQSNIRT